MSSDREYADYLEDILDSISKIANFIEGMTFDQFSRDDKTATDDLPKLEPEIRLILSDIDD